MNIPDELIEFMKAKAHHLPIEDQHALAVMLAAAPTPPAPEVEPVAWLIEIPDGDWKEIKLCRHNAIGDYREAYPGATSTPLYTHPANDRLRKAAEDVLAEYESHIASGRPLPYWAIKTLENLRAELDKNK